MLNVNYKLNDVMDEAIDRAVFFRGLSYCENDMIYQSRVEMYGNPDEEFYDDGYMIRSTVKGSGGKYYQVEVGIDGDGDIEYYDCTCPSYEDGGGACKHIVAVLIDFMNKSESYQIDDELLNDGIDESYGYSKIIDLFEDNAFVNNEGTGAKISLVPTLVIDYRENFCLSFKIGTSKLYVVKDALELFENIRDKETVSYGKKFELNHDINNFDDKSHKLIMFLVSTCKSIYGFDIDTRYNYLSYYIDKKLLRIEKDRIDDLFDFFENENINCDIDYHKFKNNDQVKFIRQNPQVKFSVEKHNDRAFVFSSDTSEDNSFHIDTANNYYIIDKNYFYRCTDEFNKNVAPTINILSDYDGHIFIPSEKYNIFYSTVIKHLSKYCEVSIDPSVGINLIDEDMAAELYLDVNEEGAIEADIVYSYGDVIFNSFNRDDKDITDKLSNIARDLRKEKEIVKAIQSFGFTDNNKKYYLDNEEMIYDFLSDGINVLMDKACINVTDRFKNIEIKNPRPISMGVKISNNLIELNIDSLDFDYSELKTILKKYKQRKKYHRLKNGSFVNINDSYFETLDRLMEDCSISEKDLSKGTIYIPKYRSLYLEKLMKNNSSLKADRSAEFKQMIRNLSNIEECDIAVPKNLNAKLRNYQENGFIWLKTLANYSLGGILADDMGLGKTIQVISILLKDKEELNAKTQSIVVCPASLVYNWQAEVGKFAPMIDTHIISGTANQRKILLDEINSHDLIITSYDSVKRDIELYKDINFRYCIVDEAQYIKNSNTQNSVAVKSLSSDIRFALTGTPIENSLSDLWSIFDFIMPGFLLSYKKFKERYEIPIVKDSDTMALDKLNSQIRPFILRRVKKEVLKELPDKIETVSYAQMCDEQRTLYKAELMKANEQFAAEISANGFDSSRIKILALLTRLRQLCCHPSLYIENYNSESAKLELCMETVHNCIETGHKMLIFSQFTSMLDIIAERLKREGVEYYVLTGKTKIGDRLNLTTRFNQNNIPVFLISLRAGGTGLNLTGADVVIHYDQWWNTSVQNQATDRTHRIGQVNKVNVIKLIVKDSIEEKIEMLQRKKQDLIDSVITEKEVMLSSLTQDEIKELLEI